MPLISCLCPTFNRYPKYGYLLEETVACFLLQELPPDLNAELLILNDTPNQFLYMDLDIYNNHHYPKKTIRPINHFQRFSSLGAKRNVLAESSEGEYLCSWDDDDLSLPHRLKQSIEHIKTSHYWKPCSCYFWPQGKEPQRDHGGVGLNASVFTKEAWKKVGGWPETNNEDLILDNKLKALGGTPDPLRLDEQPSYIYRWGVSPCHLSGVADYSLLDPHAKHYQNIGERPIVEGSFHIVPRLQPTTRRVMESLLK